MIFLIYNFPKIKDEIITANKNINTYYRMIIHNLILQKKFLNN